MLTYSGTYINQQWPYDPQMPGGAWGLHKTLVPTSPAKPIRIWMEVGDKDVLDPNAMRDDMHDWVLADEKMAAALAEKKYHYQFVFAKNAGQVHGGTKQRTLAEALEHVWKGYSAEGPATRPAVAPSSSAYKWASAPILAGKGRLCDFRIFDDCMGGPYSRRESSDQNRPSLLIPGL